ncbi:hypothetical protein [Natrialba taiwanensis]|nr:hypothetical protein [Natrialba taiwanensis]
MSKAGTGKYVIITESGTRRTDDKEEWTMLMDLLEEREKDYETEVDD